MKKLLSKQVDITKSLPDALAAEDKVEIQKLVKIPGIVIISSSILTKLWI